MQPLFAAIFYHPEVNRLYSGDALIGYMLRFESALAKAQAEHGMIPGKAAAVIADCCRVETIDQEQLAAGAALGWVAASAIGRQSCLPDFDAETEPSDLPTTS